MTGAIARKASVSICDTWRGWSEWSQTCSRVKTGAFESKLGNGKLVNPLCSPSAWLSPAALPSASSPSPLSSGPPAHRSCNTQRGSCINYTAVTRLGKKKVNIHAWKPNTGKQRESKSNTASPLTPVIWTSKLEWVGMATASIVTCNKTVCRGNKERWPFL